MYKVQLITGKIMPRVFTTLEAAQEAVKNGCGYKVIYIHLG